VTSPRQVLENAQACELAQVREHIEPLEEKRFSRHSHAAALEIQRNCEGLRQSLFQKDPAYPNNKITLQDGKSEVRCSIPGSTINFSLPRL